MQSRLNVSHLLIGHVEFGRELLFQVVQLLLETVSLLLQRQTLNLKLLTHFLRRRRKRRRRDKGMKDDEKTRSEIETKHEARNLLFKLYT